MGPHIAPGTQVVAVDTHTGQRSVGTVDAKGNYEIFGLRPSDYTVTVAGKTQTATLQVGQTVSVDFATETIVRSKNCNSGFEMEKPNLVSRLISRSVPAAKSSTCLSSGKDFRMYLLTSLQCKCEIQIPEVSGQLFRSPLPRRGLRGKSRSRRHRSSAGRLWDRQATE